MFSCWNFCYRNLVGANCARLDNTLPARIGSLKPQSLEYLHELPDIARLVPRNPEQNHPSRVQDLDGPNPGFSRIVNGPIRRRDLTVWIAGQWKLAATETLAKRKVRFHAVSADTYNVCAKLRDSVVFLEQGGKHLGSTGRFVFDVERQHKLIATEALLQVDLPNCGWQSEIWRNVAWLRHSDDPRLSARMSSARIS